MTNGIIYASNVGIGTSTLDANTKLTVYGGANVHGDLVSSNNLLVQGVAYDVNNNPYITGVNPTLTTPTVKPTINFLLADGTNNTDPTYISMVNVVTNDQTELRVNVGDDFDGHDKFVIGTTPYNTGVFTKVFEVTNQGIAYARQMIVTQNAFPDYVFSSKYELKTLNEVEKYINANKHLPGIPSAKEVADKGLDTGEMLKLQMEKIEELTLHAIAQQKKMEEQQKEMEKQNKKIEALERGLRK